MASFLLIVSILAHVFFFVAVLLDRSPSGAGPIFAEGAALRLVAIQFVGAVAVIGAGVGEDAFGESLARWLTFPVIAGHAYGFFLWRTRGDAPAATPGFRLFEDVCYAAHALIAAAALLMGVWLQSE